MTQKEYEAYEARVEGFFKSEGISGGLSIAQGEEEEGFFSWRPCECCRSSLGGTRYAVVGWNAGEKEVAGPYEVCVDCYTYAEFGKLDDMTMMDITE